MGNRNIIPINETENLRERKSPKRFFTRVLWLWVSLCSLFVVATSVFVYAWFMQEFTTPGTSIGTGTISVNLQSYKYVESELVRYMDVTDPQSSDATPKVSSELYNVMQRDIGMYADTGTTDDTYFVVRKNSGCIPIDIRLYFNLVGLQNSTNYIVDENSVVTYAGGFYYQLSDVTTAVSTYIGTTELTSKKVYSSDGQTVTTVNEVTDIEQGIYKYIQSGAANNGTERNLRHIYSEYDENESHALRTSDYCVYRLTVGVLDNASSAISYTDKSFKLELSVVAAQEDGFITHGTSKTYHVSTEAQLNTALDSYSPGDSIVLDADIDYDGDLVLTKPVYLYLNQSGGKKLTVNGNFVISYPYRDTFEIDTQNNGQIIVKKVQGADGIFRVDLPLGQLVLTGEGKTGVAEADWYVESEILWNASCIPCNCYDSGTTGYGIVIDRALLRTGTGGSDQEQVLHPIRLANNTQLTVKADTVLGKIYPDSSESTVERIVIVNYGTIQEQIDLSQMTLVGAATAYSRYRDDEHCPQIFIDNYGEIAKPIRLPALSSKFYTTTTTVDNVETVTCYGNTRIIKERVASGDMTVDSQSNSAFTTDDIEVVESNVNVIDVDGDGKNLLVYYADYSVEQLGVSLQSILKKHIDGFGYDSNHNTAAATDIEVMTVVSDGKALTSADYDYIRTLTNMTTLDLSQANSPDDKKVPASAFYGMSNLKNVTLPNDATTLGASAFEGTGVMDLYLGANMVTLESNSLGSVRGVHVTHRTALIEENLSPSSSRYVFLPTSDQLTAYRTQYSSANQYLFLEAEWLTDTDYYYRFTSSTDAQLACYVGKAWTDTQNNTLTTNINYVSKGARDYSIVSIDAYAFYQKIIANDNTQPFTPTFSDRLTQIGTSAFEGCTALGKEIDLAGCKTVGGRAFMGCTGLYSVTGNNVTQTQWYAFRDCSSLVKAVFPNAKFDQQTFRDCTKLVTIESAVYYTADSDWTNLMLYQDTNIKFWILHPESENSVAPGTKTYYLANDDRYGRCLGITSSQLVTLVSSGTNNPAGKNYYTLCRNSADVLTDTAYSHIMPSDTFLPDDYIYADATDENTEVRYTFTGKDGETTCYLSDLGYGDYVYALRDDGNGGREAVLLACLLKQIKGDYTVPATVTVTENGAAHTYPVVEIYQQAFRRTTFATTCNVTIPASVKTVGSYAFLQRTMKSVTFEGGKTINGCAFYQCTSLQTVDCGTVETIGWEAFYSCTSLKYAKGASVKTMGWAAFYNDTALISAVFPNARMTSTQCFDGCSKLVVLETAAYCLGDTSNSGWSNGAVNACTSLRLWIVHPESENSLTPNNQTYRNNGYAYTLRNYNNTKFAILFSTATTSTQEMYTATGAGSSPSTEYPIWNTGSFTAADYVYTNATLSNESRLTFKDGDETKYLSDLTNCDGKAYGDFVWGVDRTNKTATLLYSLLPSVSAGEYTLPETIKVDGEDYTVIALSTYCYKNTTFTDVHLTLHDNIQTIGAGVFQSKGIIGELDMNKVTSVGTYAFSGTKITKLWLRSADTSNATFCFSSCTSLTEIDCGEATALGGSCFNSCTALTTVNFGNVVTLKGTVFKSCTSLRYVQSDKVTSLSNEVFSGCSKLISAKFPNASLGKYAFYNCTSLVALESAVYSLNGGDNCVLLNDMTLKFWVLHPESANSVVPNGNTYASWLQGAHLPSLFDVYQSYGSGVNKKFAILVSSKDFGGTNYFSKCSNGQGINENKYNHVISSQDFLPEDYVYINAANDSATEVRVSYYDENGTVRYLSDLGYGDYVYGISGGEAVLLLCLLDKIQGDYTVPASITVNGTDYPVTSVNYGAFSRVTFVTGSKVLFPTSCASVGTGAFYSRALSEVDLNNVLTLGSYAFSASSVVTADLGDTLTSMGSYAFASCTKLVTLDCGTSLTTISSYAFQSTSALRTIDFGNVKTLSDDAFHSSGLISLDLQGVESLGNYCFESCTSLRYVEGNQATTAGAEVFDSCSKLIKVSLPNCKFTQHSTFYGCGNLLTLDVPYLNTYLCSTALAHLQYIIHLNLDSSVFNSTAVALIPGAADSVTQSNYHIIKTGSYTADKYVYGSATDTDNVTRVTYTDENGNLCHLSDLGYGDYVYAIDSDGNAIMLACLLTSIDGDYKTPKTVTYVEDNVTKTATVVAIGERAYSRMNFKSSATLTVSEGVKTIGKSAFSDANVTRTREFASIILPSTLTSISDSAFSDWTAVTSVTMYGFTAATGTNVFGSSPTFPTGFKVYVRRSAYADYTASETWGAIPKEYFALLEGAYTDTNGVTYYLSRRGDGTYQITNILDVGSDMTELTMLSYFPGDTDGNPAGNISSIHKDAFLSVKLTSGVETLTLPQYLSELDADDFLYPDTVKEFVIDAGNAEFETDGGVLYKKGKTALLIYPMSKPDTAFTLPETLSAISPGAFKNVAALQTVTQTAETSFTGYLFLHAGAFDTCPNLTEVTIGRSAIVADLAFTNCVHLLDVHYTATNDPIFLGNDPYDGLDINCIHTMTAYPAVAETCTTDGNSAYWQCSLCDKYFSDANGENQISYGDWIIAAHHTVEHHDAVAATEEANGNIEYWYCTVCEKYFKNAVCSVEIMQAETVTYYGGYTGLSYIQSSGTQYIDTGVSATSNMRFETKIDFTGFTGDYYFSSIRNADGGSRYYLLNINNSSGFAVCNNSWGKCTSGTSGITTTPAVIVSSINGNNLSLTVNGTEYTSTDTWANPPDYTFPLFAGNVGGTISVYPGTVKCYYARYYSDGVLVRNLVPVIRDSDSAVGMYDTVTKTFYANAGTGVFTAGY